MVRAMLDGLGRPVAFYMPKIHGDDIPVDAIEITDEQWRECLAHQGRRKIVVTGEGEEQTVTVEPYDPPLPALADAQAERIARIKREAHRLLQPTDWYVVRQAETSEAIPQAVSNYRAAVRTATDQAEADINALTDSSAVLAYQVSWPAEIG